MKREHFIVDASLVEELGIRLIGRPTIALGELIKNSYDADASTCKVEFGHDQITVTDDGTGMSSDDFLKHWMRIGTTHKVDQKTSKEHSRPLTGSKGVGRLSVQFLASEMELLSTTPSALNESLYAVVDWRGIVRGTDLNTVNVDWETRKDVITFANDSPHGTKVILKNLKTTWDAAALEGLGREVWRLRSPFRRSPVSKGQRRPEDFDVEVIAPGITGAREAFDKVMRALFANWKARIRGSLNDGRASGTATVSIQFKADYPEGTEEARTFRERVRIPIRRQAQETKPLLDRVAFEILIFKPEGRQPEGVPVAELREYLAEFGNVSVYDAGFRLPYYGVTRSQSVNETTETDTSGEDWLSIAVDQGRRLNSSNLLPAHLKTSNKYMQDLPAPGRIFGAVDINTNHERIVAEHRKAEPGEWLQIQPGRDRLHDNLAFSQLKDLVRFSLDFYANRYRLLAVQVAERKKDKEPASRKYDKVVEVLDENRKSIPAAVYREVRAIAVDAKKTSAAGEELLDQRAALLAPLATAGMVTVALNHEFSREARFLDRIGNRLRKLAQAHSIPELTEIAQEFDQARRRLQSLLELFAPLLSDEDSAATDRLRVRGIVDQTSRAMQTLMPRTDFDLTGIPSDLRFPLGPYSEWNALLQNILANAWNAMLDSPQKRVAFDGGRSRNGLEWLKISDTGEGLGIPLDEAPSLFEPFERRLVVSEDKRSIAIGGQGLGLAIVRMIAQRRDVNVAFVEPLSGYSTTIELSWRGTKK